MGNKIVLLRRVVLQITVILLTVALTTGAAAAVNQPDSGSALNQVNQSQPPLPEEKAEEVTIQETPVSIPADNHQKIHVAGFRFSGETILPEKELLSLVNEKTAQDLSLSDLYGFADRVTRYLVRKGYPVASAYIPAQHIKEGIVTIAVVPGKFGAIRIDNQTRIPTVRLQKILAVLAPGAIITQKNLERAMLLLNDLSGVKAQASLKPGESAGTSDLAVEVADTAIAGGNIYADTWGNRYTGSARSGVQLTLYNFDYLGDEFRLGGMSSLKGMDNCSFDYSLPLSGNGLQLNLDCNTVGYTLGEDFAALDATGQAQVYGLELSYPFIRSRGFNLSGKAGFEVKELKDDIGSTGTFNPRTSHLWHLALTGNAIDSGRGGGANSFALTIYGGSLDICDSAAYGADAAGANSAGWFGKAVLDFRRNQSLCPGLNLELRCTGQLATKNLDSSEKFYLGGADGVRAYPQGEGSGDQGCRLTAEVEWRLPGTAGDREHLYLVGFCDYGYLNINENPWSSAANSRSLSAFGIGLIYTWNSFYLRCDYAWKLGDTAATSDADQPGRFWIRAVKNF